MASLEYMIVLENNAISSISGFHLAAFDVHMAVLKSSLTPNLGEPQELPHFGGLDPGLSRLSHVSLPS